MPPYQYSERTSVQNPLLDYVQESSAEYTTKEGANLMLELGWEYVKPEEAMRLKGGREDLVFREVFVNQMQRLNTGFMDNLMAEDLIKQFERIPPTREGNLTAWEYLKGLKTVFVAYDKREKNVAFIDTDNIDRNVFQVTDEFTFSNGKYTTRIDVAFLINGIPVLLAETKAAHKPEGIAEALDQVRRYHQHSPEMLAMLQVYALTHIIKFYYSATWNTTQKLLYNWKDESAGDNYEGLVKTFFDKRRIVRLLSNFILFTREDDELKKVILRPHQMRAVQKLTNRAADKDKQGALVWHTQGSGKTYTMITTADLVMKDPRFSNPTVILLVDRNELETQLFSNLQSVGIENFELADIYDIISPDRFLRPYLADYQFLCRIYKIVKEAFDPSISIDREFSSKTAQLVQKYSHGGKIKDTLDIYEINGKTLEKLEESNASDTEKIFNLVKSMHQAIQNEGNEQPYLISIGEKANQIVEAYKQKQKSTRETLNDLKDLINEVNQARKEQAEKNMPVEVFTIFWELKTRKIREPEDKANQMQQVLENYPHWQSSKSHEREVKKDLYELMLKDKDKKVPEVTRFVNEIFDNLKLGKTS